MPCRYLDRLQACPSQYWQHQHELLLLLLLLLLQMLCSRTGTKILVCACLCLLLCVSPRPRVLVRVLMCVRAQADPDSLDALLALGVSHTNELEQNSALGVLSSFLFYVFHIFLFLRYIQSSAACWRAQSSRMHPKTGRGARVLTSVCLR